MARRQSRPDPNEAALAGARCLNPHPEQVTDPEFGASDFFDARDAVQVKYEMVRKVRAAAPRSPRPRRRRVLPPGLLRRGRRAGILRAGRTGPRQARTARRSQAHRADPRLGRAAAGRRPRPAPGTAAGPDRGVLRRARAPPVGRASAGPPPGAALQKPLTCPPARKERSARPLSLRPSPGHAAAEPGARPDAGQATAPGGGTRNAGPASARPPRTSSTPSPNASPEGWPGCGRCPRTSARSMS